MLKSFLNHVLNIGDSSQFYFFTNEPVETELKTYSVRVSVKSQPGTLEFDRFFPFSLLAMREDQTYHLRSFEMKGVGG